MVLLDLRLPGMDGLEVLSEMRSHESLAEMPVVVLTTCEADDDRVESYRSQISAYIVKPMGFDSFAIKPAILNSPFAILFRRASRRG